MKAEEHPLSQKPLGPLRLDSGEQMKLLADKLLKAEQENELLKHYAKMAVDQIQELEETIQKLKLDSMEESKRLIDENRALKTSNTITQILNQVE